MASASPHVSSCSLDWLELPGDVFIQIFILLGNFKDQHSFSRVCRSWRDFASSIALPPCLLLPQKTESSTRSFLFYPYSRTLKCELPELQEKKLYPTSRGSWFLVLGLDPEVSLFNPIICRKICLPSLTTINTLHFDASQKKYSVYWTNMGSNNEHTQTCRLDEIRDNLILKATLSSCSKDPHSEIVMIVIHYYYSGKYVYFCKPGAEQWSSLPLLSSMAMIYDLEYSMGHFYILDYGGRIQVVSCSELKGTSDLTKLSFSLLNLPTDLNPSPRGYDGDVVGSQRGLFFIRRTGVKKSAVDYDVLILETNQQHGPLWRKMNNVSDLAFFIYGRYSQLSFISDGVHEFKGNRIYLPAFYRSDNRSACWYPLCPLKEGVSLRCDIIVHDISNGYLGRCPTEWSPDKDSQRKVTWFSPSFD